MVSPDMAAGAAAEAAQSAPAPSTPDSGTTTDPGTSAAPSGQPAGQAPLVDITDPDRYRYNGRSVKDWDAGYMRQQDYSAKTQQIAQERKYYENLHYDLDKVRQDPALVEQFKQIYPEKFHSYLRFISQGTPSQPPQAPGQQPAGQQFARLDPKTQATIDRLLTTTQQAELKAINAEIDNVFGKMTTKYPYADEEACIARGQALLQVLKKQDPLNPDLRITEQQWDAIWKSQHERGYQLADAQYKKTVKAQIEASRKGADAGGGGGVPGQAPRQYKTIKEATNQALADIELGSL